MSDSEPPKQPCPENEAEKKKDYRNTVAIQIVFLAMALLADDLLRLAGWSARGLFFDGLFHLSGGIYLLALADMLRNYTKSKNLVRSSFIVLIIAFVLTVTANLVIDYDNPGRVPVLFVAHALFAVVQFEVIAFAIRDLFRSSHKTSDRLWGSACIYFMSGFAFASLYLAILMVEPRAFGGALSADSYVYFETIYLSFNALVGLDTSYPQASRLVRNLSLIQGLWSQLYLVLLIGRVLTPNSIETN